MVTTRSTESIKKYPSAPTLQNWARKLNTWQSLNGAAAELSPNSTRDPIKPEHARTGQSRAQTSALRMSTKCKQRVQRVVQRTQTKDQV